MPDIAQVVHLPPKERKPSEPRNLAPCASPRLAHEAAWEFVLPAAKGPFPGPLLRREGKGREGRGRPPRAGAPPGLSVMPPPAPLTDTSLPVAPSVLEGRREAFLAGLLLGLPAFHLPVLFHRHSSLQQIIPAANVFQELVDAFQDWLSLTEQKLAQLWAAHGSLAQSQEAHQQIQARCRESLKEAPIPGRRRGQNPEWWETLLSDKGAERATRPSGVTWALAFLQALHKEIQSKTAELEEALQRGQRLLQMVPGKWRRQAPVGGRVRPPRQGPRATWRDKGGTEGQRVAEASAVSSLQQSHSQKSKAAPDPEGPGHTHLEVPDLLRPPRLRSMGSWSCRAKCL